MNKIAEAIDGYKSYILMVVGIAALVSVNLFGLEIPGLVPSEDWVAQVWILLGFGAAKSAVAKIE